MEQLLRCKPEPDVKRALWVVENIRPFNERTLQTVVPAGLEQYIRICQPAWRWKAVDPNDEETFSKIRSGRYGWEYATQVRWSDVAKETGTIAHPRMQWHTIAPPTFEPGDAGISAPIEYEITSEMVDVLFDILIDYSGNDQECLCAFWEGYGTLDFLEYARNTKVEGIGQQKYFLFNASLEDIRAQWSSVLAGKSETAGMAPNALWPTTQDWYFSVPIGYTTPYFGGSASLVNKICASTLETYEAFLSDDILTDKIG